MGMLRIMFGKYLLVTNTVSCGVMMGFGDVLQQRGDHWRQSLSKFFGSEEIRATDKKITGPMTARAYNLNEDTIDGKGSISLVTNMVGTVNESCNHDFVRTKNMIAVGLAQGPFHHYFYLLLDRFLPGRNAGSVLMKTFVDQLVASPTCLGIFFFGLGALEQRKVEDISGEMRSKFFNTYKVDCCFWPPTQFINFLFVPVHYRVIYINLMTMFYDIFLSYMKYDAE